MAGKRGLHCHLGGFQVADLTHHDNVRVLPHQAADTGGKVQPDFVVHLRLVKPLFHHFDRVFNSTDIDFVSGDLPQRRIKGGGFTGTSWTGNQQYPVGAREHGIPARVVITHQT